jgi:hypothetical protein
MTDTVQSLVALLTEKKITFGQCIRRMDAMSIRESEIEFPEEPDSVFAIRSAWRERRKIVYSCGSFALVDALLAVMWSTPGEIWLRLVRDVWSSIDGDRRQLVEHVRQEVEETDHALHHLMTPGVRRKLAALPEHVAAYRGCYEGINDDGVSYSLDRDVAVRFPTLMRYRIDGETPVLLTRTLIRNMCFLVDGRDEHEIVDLWATPDEAHVEYLEAAAA